MNAEILFKIESINSCLMSLSTNQKNFNVSLPDMDRRILLENIERLIIQNMEYRKNFDEKEHYDYLHKDKSISLEFDQNTKLLTGDMIYFFQTPKI